MISLVQSPYPGTAVTGLRKTVRWSNLVSLVNRYRNRREVASLREFSDLQLTDIGLTRRDVGKSLRGGMFDDHSRELARTALLRRTFVHLL